MHNVSKKILQSRDLTWLSMNTKQLQNNKPAYIEWVCCFSAWWKIISKQIAISYLRIVLLVYLTDRAPMTAVKEKLNVGIHWPCDH